MNVFIGESVLLNDGSLFVSELIELSKNSLKFSENCNVELLDYHLLQNPLKIRSWKKGDWFIPLGMSRKKKLHDFFIDEKVPVYRRLSIPLLYSGDDLVWILGFRIDERFKVRNQTKQVLRVKHIICHDV
jgi:tRNA(Ile)-lysidine synthase